MNPSTTRTSFPEAISTIEIRETIFIPSVSSLSSSVIEFLATRVEILGWFFLQTDLCRQMSPTVDIDGPLFSKLPGALFVRIKANEEPIWIFEFTA